MSHSSLVSYVKISPHKNSPRNHKIDTISIHCMAGNCSIETCGNIFQHSEASSNYGIGSDGRIACYVEEEDRSWCTSSRSNDNRAITIEVANTVARHPWPVSDEAYKSLIKLLVDICKRNDIKKLLWRADKSLIGQVDKQNMTVHRWFANKACPGDWLYSRHGQIADEVNRELEKDSNKSKTGWYVDEKGWYYLNEGNLLKFTWVMDSKDWCFIGEDGYMLKNAWAEDSKGWCYVGSDGRLVRNGWIKDSVDWCYVDSSGHMLKDTWVKDRNGWSYLKSDGRILRDGYAYDSYGKRFVDKHGYMIS